MSGKNIFMIGSNPESDECGILNTDTWSLGCAINSWWSLCHAQSDINSHLEQSAALLSFWRVCLPGFLWRWEKKKKKKSIVNPTVRIRGKLQLQHVDRAEHVEQTAGWKVHGLKWWQPPLTRQGRPCSDESSVLRAKTQDIRWAADTLTHSGGGGGWVGRKTSSNWCHSMKCPE